MVETPIFGGGQDRPILDAGPIDWPGITSHNESSFRQVKSDPHAADEILSSAHQVNLFLAQETPVRSVDKVCSVSDTQGEAVQTTSQIGNHRCHRILGNSMKAMDVHPPQEKVR